MATEHTTHVNSTGIIVANDGRGYPDDTYTEATRAVGSQQEVADWWAQGKLPTHETSEAACVLRTTTDNFRGYQYPDRHGRLVHYSTLEAIRTREGLIVDNIECWSRGMAKCNVPRDPSPDARLPLTSIKDDLRDSNDIYRIVDVTERGDGRLIEFEDGRELYVEGEDKAYKSEWESPKTRSQGDPLGRL